MTLTRTQEALKGHSGAELHIYFWSILKVYTISYFSIAKLFLTALLRNNYLSPKCIGDQSNLGISSFFTSFSPQYIFGGVTNTILSCCTYRSESVGKRKKTFPRRIMIISARCTTNMRRQVDNVNRRSRHLADDRTYRQSLEFPSVRMKLQISYPLR